MPNFWDRNRLREEDMSTTVDKHDGETALRLQQGRWFHVVKDGAIRDGSKALPGPADDQRQALAVRENLALLTRLPSEAREQLLDQFLCGVSGQLSGQLTLSRPPAREDARAANIAVMYRYIELENARDYEEMEKIFHPTEFRSKTYFGNDPISPKAHTRMLKGLFRAFPDWFMVINEVISADEQSCVALITGRGTQFEEFFGRPPRDHQIAIPTLHAIKVRDGLIIEHRHINPFEDIFANQIMAPLTEDIMAVRAQQGFDSTMAQRAYDAAVASGVKDEDLAELKALIETKRRQCQVLLKGTLRRCAMIAPPGEIYCEHHQNHGYGIDGIE
jgi:predicted ester cyclase